MQVHVSLMRKRSYLCHSFKRSCVTITSVLMMFFSIILFEYRERCMSQTSEFVTVDYSESEVVAAAV